MSTNTTTNAFKLNPILVNESMRFIQSIDPKEIHNNCIFANVMLDDSVREQLDLELAQSFKLFKNKVKRYVGTLKVTDIENLFQQYVEALDTSKHKYVQFHKELMITNKNTKSKWFTVAMTELIAAQLTSSRYVELNHIALLVGRQLINKESNGDVTIAVSLGANVLEFLRSINVVNKSFRRNKENHLIATVEVANGIVIPKELEQSANSIRANSPMLVKPLEHTPLSEGGMLLQRAVMLNNKKLEHGFNFYRVVNYLNQQPLQLRVDDDLISEWFTTDRFYTDELTELRKEKLKVIADLELFKDKTFYINHQADDRGRLYAGSNYLNTQGDSYQKAMFIGNKEVLTEDGINALKISIVNEVHDDKISREEAIAWFDMNQDKLVLTTALSKVYYRDYKDAIEGKEVGSIIHQDMTNSGLGVYSLLGKDELGASLTNLLFKGKLADAYKALADALNKEFGITNLNRSTVKKAFMVFLYGSGKNLLLSSDIDDDRYTSLLEAIVEVNNLDYTIEEVWSKFEVAITRIAPAAIKLMQLIYKFKNKDSHYKFVMPDGFIVDIQVMSKTPTEHKGFSVSLDGKTHSHTVHTIEKLLDNKYDKSLAPHIIHSIDAYILRCIVRECKALDIPIYVIHDSFGTTPNYYYTLNLIVRQVLAKILSMDLLEDILGQLDKAKLDVAISKGMLPKGQLSEDNILNAVNAVR